MFIILSTALRVSRALRLKPEKGAHVGMYLELEGKAGKNPERIEGLYFKMGKKSTRVAAGVPDSMVRLPARSADERSGEQINFSGGSKLTEGNKEVVDRGDFMAVRYRQNSSCGKSGIEDK